MCVVEKMGCSMDAQQVKYHKMASNQVTGPSGTPQLSARGVVGKKISDDTKAQYQRYYNRFSIWLQENCPDEYRRDDETVDFSDIPVEIFEEAFEHFQYTGDGDGKAFVSKSKMDMYRKALVHYHKEQGLYPLPKDVSDFFKDYIKGYANVVAEEKHAGRMNPNEGKDPMTGT